MSNGFHLCTRDGGAWVYRPEATVVAVADFAEGTVVDTSDECVTCALYDALLDRRARIIAPNASGVRVPMPAVVGARIKEAFANASKVSVVETRPPAAVQPGSPPLAGVAAVEFPLVARSADGVVVKVNPALPKKGQTLSMFGAAIMAAAPSGPKPPDAYVRRKELEPKLSDLHEVHIDFTPPSPVDEKAKRRSNILRLVKGGKQ